MKTAVAETATAGARMTMTITHVATTIVDTSWITTAADGMNPSAEAMTTRKNAAKPSNQAANKQPTSSSQATPDD
jgi:hypothetical protein